MMAMDYSKEMVISSVKHRWLTMLFKVVWTIILPVLILSKLNQPEIWPIKITMSVALALPLAYGFYEYYRERNISWLAIFGLVSVAATGLIGWLEVDAKWLAIKEALLPALIGCVILGSRLTPRPLLLVIIGQVLNLPLIEKTASEQGVTGQWQRRIRRATSITAAAFFLSAGLNFITTKIIVVSQPGSAAFNQEIARLTLISYPVIAVPAMSLLLIAILYLISGAEKVTGLAAEDLLRSSE